ncbi:MAG: ABC transporter ATP-binding protein, partial [Candidatus Atribacteria bacterium]|nr:ABC transporter ATP-binding protein [Candidatus Atribacteria bacterium]
MNGVEMKGITKVFGNIIANQKIDFDLKYGEIHALLGENGAGKSTLMNILYGFYRPDSGHIFIHGQKCDFRSPFDAIRAGIGMVHQHFMLIPGQTVWENMIIGLNTIPQILPKQEIKRQILELSEKYCLQIDPMSFVWQLSIGEQQRVAILQMLYRKAKLLILDEPTAVLTLQESQNLFKMLTYMASEGYGIIFISHKLDEVMSLSHRVTILRKGEKVGSVLTNETTKEKLAEMMMGQKFVFSIQKRPVSAGPLVVDIQNLRVRGDRGFQVIRDLSLQIHRGEVLGLAGVAGNGQQELCEALSGLRRIESGKIKINQQELTNRPPRYFIKKGLRYIPADRRGVGLIPNMMIDENAILKKYWKSPISKGSLINWHEVAQYAHHLIRKYDIAIPHVRYPVKNLSGGNLQKLMLGRELSDSPQVIIAMHPTWGLDVAATKFVREQILKERDQGASVLLISEDIEELIALSDRLAVI